MTAVGVLVFAVTAFLATSIGGAGIVASPVTLPTMYLVVRHHPTRAFRTAAAAIGGITALEAGWAAAYVLGAGETAAFGIGIAAAAAVATLAVKAGNRAVAVE